MILMLNLLTKWHLVVLIKHYSLIDCTNKQYKKAIIVLFREKLNSNVGINSQYLNLFI